MYDVVKMKGDLADAVQIVGRRIQNEFVSAFKRIYNDDRVPRDPSELQSLIHCVRVAREADLSKIFRRAGFYVILTDYPVEGNSCRLTAGNLRAVYRGECSEVRLRLTSHLANSTYRQQIADLARRYVENPKNAGKQFYKETWPHCLKLEKGGRSGIDVEKPPYSEHEWLVIVHPMVGSSQEVRKLAEAAFDEAFDHPAASRDA